jgi:peroxiredoxin Q/BCP
MKLKIGDLAPDFTLFDQNGASQTLSTYRGQWVLVYFYPKDNTPGCTKEACALRDAFPQFEQLSMPVLGISTDSVKSHASFGVKYQLPFLLLADEQKTVVELYDVKGLLGTARRVSFLIDPEGKIAKIYETVKPAEHAAEVLRDVQTFMQKA